MKNTHHHPLAVTVLALCLSSALPVFAQTSPAEDPVSLPWTPSLHARSALQFLADEGGLGLSISHWPLPAAAVHEALQAMPADASSAVQAARSMVLGELQEAQGAALGLRVRNRSEALSGFGEEGSPGSQVDVRSPVFAGPHAAAQLGLRADQIPEQALSAFQDASRVRLHHAAAATRLWGWNLQASAAPRWWGVGWQSSLVLSHNAPSMTSLSLQRASAKAPQHPWASWVGPWSFEAFLGRMEYHSSPADPLLLGTRLTFRPLPSLEVGLTKVTQTAGEGRPGGLRNLLRAFVGEGSNADTPTQALIDPGNSLGGFDVRWRCPTGWGCAVYGQMIGEDEAGALPSKFLGLGGAEMWSSDGRQRYFAEYSNSFCRGLPGEKRIPGCAYGNGAYAQGYTHHNRWLGASQGSDARLLTLGWLDSANGQSLRLHTGQVGRAIGNRVPGATYSGSGSLRSVQWQRHWKWGDAIVTPELSYTRLQTPGPNFKEWRAGASVAWAL